MEAVMVTVADKEMDGEDGEDGAEGTTTVRDAGA